MVDASVQTEKLTIDEYMRLYDSEGPFEIIDGERVEKLATVFGHSEILSLLVELLQNFVRENRLGRIYPEAAFILPDPENRQWVKGARIPDILYIQAERLKTYRAETENYRGRPLMLVPDLTIEIISENDIYKDIKRKVQIYLEDGVRLVWVIDPFSQSVMVWEQGKQPQDLTKDDTLSGGDIIPGFEIQISTILEEPEEG
jgi:Uma2 family endonuclease